MIFNVIAIGRRKTWAEMKTSSIEKTQQQHPCCEVGWQDMLLTWRLKFNNTDWCLELVPENGIENYVKLWILEMEGGACGLRHFLGRGSVFCIKGSLWSWSFDDQLLGAKATCEVADREQIAKEAERKICFNENGITSNNPTRPCFPRDMVPAWPYGLGRDTANATTKSMLLLRAEAAAIHGLYWGSEPNAATSLALWELTSIDSNHQPLDVQPEFFLNLIKLLWGLTWWYILKMAFGFMYLSRRPFAPTWTPGRRLLFHVLTTRRRKRPGKEF